MLPLQQRQISETWEHYKMQRSFGDLGQMDRKVLSLYFMEVCWHVSRPELHARLRDVSRVTGSVNLRLKMQC
jgi:hypothetical protein